MLIAADDALESAINAGYRSTSEVVDNKFRMAIDLLDDFAQEFPLKNSTSDPNIGGTVTGEVKMSVESKSPLMILHALKTNLHSNVKFPSVSFLPTLIADGEQPMGDNWWGAVWREIDFYVLSSLHDRHPIVIRRVCHAIDFSPVSDSCSSDAQSQSEHSRDSAGFQPF